MSVVGFVFEQVLARYPVSIPAFILAGVQAILEEYAGKALTEELRGTIQRRLLDVLASAGAPGRDS